MISVQPDAEMRLSDLSLDVTKFVKTSDTDTPVVYYTDKDAGVRYKVSDSEIVRLVDYIPKSADYSLRCKAFHPLLILGIANSTHSTRFQRSRWLTSGHAWIIFQFGFATNHR